MPFFGIYIVNLQHCIPILFNKTTDETIKKSELLRWGRYQQRQGKTAEEALAHNARCGVSYFPLTVDGHIELLKKTGFHAVHVFWISYMQMGIYAIK